MTNILIGIVAAVAAFVIAYKVTKSKEKKKSNGVGGEIESELGTLSGELIDIVYDPELKLTRITVRDNMGVTQFGFSNLSAKQLETLYAGKGYVTIPVVKKK